MFGLSTTNITRMAPTRVEAAAGIALAGLLGSLAACGPVVTRPTRLDSPELQAAVPRGKYEILPGDELEIRFFYTPELNVTLPVRPDGYISLPRAREVRAAGRTPEELARVLARRFQGELRDPEIAVVVRSFTSQRIHVGGKVESPGVFPLGGGTTVLESLFHAGGTLPEARLSEIVVIRKRPEGSYLVIPVNIEAVLDGSDVSQNIQLLPFDAVYVPDSPIGEVNKWVDLYIRRNIPINFGFRPDVPF